MKEFSLEEYLKNPSRKVVTREGRNVRILCVDKKGGDLPIIALIQQCTINNEIIGTFTKEGKWSTIIEEQPNDLFFAPKNHTDYINLYRNEFGYFLGGGEYSTEDEAKEVAARAGDTYITTIKAEWEEE